jgi:formylmethanofuran dehydrogenase subunit E
MACFRIFIHIQLFFLNIIHFFKKLFSKKEENNNSEEKSLLDKSANQNTVKERWKSYSIMNKIFIYPSYNSSNSLKIIVCNKCSKNITSKNWHCLNDNIYCNDCYFTIPIVKQVLYK